MRHIEIRDLWLQKEIREGKVEVHKVLGTENPADLMTKILTVKEIEERLRRMSIVMRITNRVQMASVETSEIRKGRPAPISSFGAGQGENNISVCKLDDRPTSNFTLWRGAV